MNYLSSEEITKIHDKILSETGGLKGVFNRHALLMLDTQPAQFIFGQELYPDIYLKSAFILRTINKDHVFNDGNKRTSIATAIIFLNRNDYFFESSNEELENFVIYVAENNLSLEEIALWIKNHSKAKII